MADEHILAELLHKLDKFSLYPSEDAAAENPRNKGSGRYASLEIVRREPGVSVPAYFAAGGNADRLRENMTKGYITTKQNGREA